MEREKNQGQDITSQHVMLMMQLCVLTKDGARSRGGIRYVFLQMVVVHSHEWLALKYF